MIWRSWRDRHPVHFTILSVSMRNSVLKNISRQWLQEADIPVPRTHNLRELLALILPTLPAWAQWQPDVKKITEYAVDSRYPGESATPEDTQHAMHTCEAVRQAVRTSLKLPTHEVNN